MSDTELGAVWHGLDELGLQAATALRLMLLTAARVGEVRQARWEHIDLDTRTWTLPGEPDGRWPGTKNGQTHAIPLTDGAVALLQDLGPQGAGWVFPGRGDRAMGAPRTNAIWQALGLERFRPHDLRATVATGMDRLGIAKEHISRVLNHVEGGVTAGYIRHEADEQKRRALEAWGRRLDEIVTGRAAGNVVELSDILR